MLLQVMRFLIRIVRGERFLKPYNEVGLWIRCCSGKTRKQGYWLELARLGTLTTTEAAELDSYIHVSNLLAVMESKARQSLRVLEL
jgi:hypothetical protein